MYNMEFFMEEDLTSKQEVEVPGISKFKYPCDGEGYKKGDIVPWKLKPITTERLDELTKQNTEVRIIKGKRINKLDEKRLTNEMLVDSIVYPNFKDENWLKKYNCLDPVDLLLRILDLPGDYARISKEVCEVNGITDTTEEELIEQAKN